MVLYTCELHRVLSCLADSRCLAVT